MDEFYTDEFYMRRALELAEKGRGYTNPNPMVGAVIVKDNRIIGEGYHHRYGDLHAERDAIKNCTESAENATIYVTLEPCCHQGKQPPCTEAVLAAGIKRVVIGSMDPNPLVAGKGIEFLKENGVTVEGPVLNKECLELNRVFFSYIKNKKPYVIMKYAQTLDGKIATYKGLSQWITGEEAREKVHEDRHKFASIMVGAGTVIKDNPTLTCRSTKISNPNNPIRIICDTNLRTPYDCNLIKTIDKAKLIIATCSDDIEKIGHYEKLGCMVIKVPKDNNGHVDLKILVQELGRQGIDSIIAEGGGELNWSLLQAGLVNRVQVYIGSKIFGGENAKTAVEGKGVDTPDDAIIIKNKEIHLLGNDILIEGDVE